MTHIETKEKTNIEIFHWRKKNVFISWNLHIWFNYYCTKPMYTICYRFFTVLSLALTTLVWNTISLKYVRVCLYVLARSFVCLTTYVF